jgi:hypothetical protein
MDLTGLRIGVGRGRWVIVPSDARTRDGRLARYRRMIVMSVFDTERVPLLKRYLAMAIRLIDYTSALVRGYQKHT